jgi:hypothetical protein
MARRVSSESGGVVAAAGLLDFLVALMSAILS